MYLKSSRIIFVYFCIFGVNCQNPEVKISQGRLRGAERTNLDGNIYYSFQNIPYAKPPVGELRFKSPEPADGWEGIRDATEDVPQCLQLVSDPENVNGQEDCLYLNVYIPDLPDENAEKKPVMVYIHGGAFNTKSATETEFGGEFLLTKDVVLVVINYRLGIFGYGSLDDPNLGVPGNAAMRDQVLALKWVHNNIVYFSGDSNNVLIFGESAGGMNVHYHILSQMSKGLFHKAILQSGVSLGDFVIPEFRNNIIAFAELLGIQTENWEEMLTSLQNVDAKELAIAEGNLTDIYTFISRPVVEISTNEEPFLQDYPFNIINSGNYNQVPIITGINDAEGLRHELRSRRLTGLSVLITDFTEFVPREFQIEAGSEEEENLSERIKYFYYRGEEPNRNNITAAVNLYGDFEFDFPAYRMIMEHIKTAEYPIYFYYFSADTQLNRAKLGSDSIIIDYAGAAHGDDLGYMFSYTKIPDIIDGTFEELRLRDMVNLWTNFAIYGTPTPDNFADFKWTPVEKDQFNYLHVGTDIVYFQSDSKPIAERLEFWWEIYQEYTLNNQ